MAMPDAVTALVSLLEADRASAHELGLQRQRLQPLGRRYRRRACARAFPGADISYQPDDVRARIVDSWPEDLDDTPRSQDWGWNPAYDAERAFEDYLLPTDSRAIRALGHCRILRHALLEPSSLGSCSRC
jgi:threonine 3-dehydrogenase